MRCDDVTANIQVFLLQCVLPRMLCQHQPLTSTPPYSLLEVSSTTVMEASMSYPFVLLGLKELENLDVKTV